MKLCPTCRRCYDDADSVCPADNAALVPSHHGSRLIAGKYLLERLLGRGGMGAVYAGLHVDLDRQVAVKLLLPDLISEAEAMERFRREAQAAARLNHPNVADTYDYGILPDGGAYIVMELVDGRTLREYMNTSGPLPVAVALHLATQIAEAIEAAHAGGIVHRDLKPSNIVLRPDKAGDWEAKVVDFGVAKLKEQTTSTGGGLTGTGSLIGTPRYMSPEQCMGQKTDARSDIYSLGVILYEMLSGSPPFDAPTPTAVAIKHIQQPPPSILATRPDLPASLAELLDQTLQKDPQARPQTATELARRLREVVRELPDGGAAGEMGAAISATDERQPETHIGAGPQTHPLAGIGPETQRSNHPTEESLPVHQDFQTGPSVVGYDSAPVTQARTETTNAPRAEGMTKGDGADLSTLTAARASEQRAPVADAQREQSRARKFPLLYLLLAAIILASLLVIIVLLWPTSSRQANEAGTASSTQARPDANSSAQANATTTPAAPANSTVSGADGARQAVDARGGETAELRTLLNDWVMATNARDVNRQMTFYAPSLESFYLQRGASRADVREEKRRIFSQLSSVEVSTSEPEIILVEGGRTAIMRFHKSWNFKGTHPESGEVIQELRWRKTDSGWKIVSERDLQKLR